MMYSDMGMRSTVRNGQFGEENVQSEYIDDREKSMNMPPRRSGSAPPQDVSFFGDGSADWGFQPNGAGRGRMGVAGLGGIGDRRNCGVFEDDTSQARSISRFPSRPVSCNAFDVAAESSASQLAQLSASRSRNNYASTLGSLSRSATPDPHVIARAPSFRIPSVGGGSMNFMDKTSLNPPNSLNDTIEFPNLLSAFSGMGLSTDCLINEENSYFPNKTYDQSLGYNTPGKEMYTNMDKLNGLEMDPKGSFLINDGPYEYRKRALLANPYFKGPSTKTLSGGGFSPSWNQNIDPLYANNPLGSDYLPLAMGANGMDSRTLELHNLRLMRNRMPITDPVHLQYLRSREYAASHLAIPRKPVINNKEFRHMDLIELEKAYMRALLASQRPQYGVPYNGKFDAINNGFYGEQNFPCGMRNFAGILDESLASALLEEFKSNKTKYFELSEIVGHVVEFSADQYGSRFIQQKLETATEEEKNMIFYEIMPQALTLMTDVFGNYVIQKFFEQGSPAQIRELASQLNGKVLALSLQMYGCRVIQKAIEVVDLDQQIKMVNELDGNIMRCVHDQNGNHVIQKCIECIPEDAIQFIVSTFYDQVVTLSTHPYGCRVIQRVLEHCHDPKTQQIMMDEVLKFVCMLAQDQYGNYVIQHVLEHGKPHERSTIIQQLTGQIVHMSQQKFASNVVEKCLTFGDIVERQTLVTEMLGTTDENEPLQAMMKDQFGNYVVQKVLETCDEQQLELILNRIKVHLNALKKFTYGKHIFARVEKLVAAGERRISSQAIQSS